VYYIFNERDKRFIIKGTEVSADAFLHGKSDYFIVRNDDLEYAIFDRNGKQISQWFDWIYLRDLIGSQSNYYIAEKNGKQAVFHKNGNQVTDWFERIYSYGLADGQSEYYMAEINKLLYVCKLGSRKIIGPFKSIFNYGFIEDPSQDNIIVKTSTDQYVALAKQEADEFFEDKEVENER
jgi:hypothetical protein